MSQQEQDKTIQNDFIGDQNPRESPSPDSIMKDIDNEVSPEAIIADLEDQIKVARIELQDIHMKAGKNYTEENQESCRPGCQSHSMARESFENNDILHHCQYQTC